MSADVLLKIDEFFKMATKSKLPEKTDNTSELLKNLSKLETFTDRVKYAEKCLKRISSGSSRVIFLMPNEKEVLKLAKNDRGIAQNKSESDIKSYLVNKTNKMDKKGYWKITPFLDKITEKEFESLSDMNFKEFGDAIFFALKEISDNSLKKQPKNMDAFLKNKLFKDLVALSKKHNLMPGDIKRISSWGKLNEKPILLDAGLNKKIFDKFY